MESNADTISVSSPADYSFNSGPYRGGVVPDVPVSRFIFHT